MTGLEHCCRAEGLAAEAHRLLGQGDGQASRPGKRPGAAAAWNTSGSRATAATTSSGRRCSSNRRTTAGTGWVTGPHPQP
jgi:hypothetical protein